MHIQDTFKRQPESKPELYLNTQTIKTQHVPLRSRQQQQQQ